MTTQALPSSEAPSAAKTETSLTGTPLVTLTWTALRAVSGLLFAVHGMQKVLGWFATREQPPVFSQLWIGGVIELVTGLLIAAGLFTRPAAFLASGTMAVAYIQFHWKFAFADGAWLPVLNHGELSVIYCFLFLFLFAAGGGRWSLDAVRKERAQR